MLTKQKVLDAIRNMPGDEVDVEQLIELIYLLAALEQGEEDIAQGRVYTNEQMKEMIDSWHPSSGQTLPKAI